MSKTIAIPYDDLWFNGAHKRFNDLFYSLANYADDSICFKLVAPSEVDNHKFDGIFLFRCHFFKNADINKLSAPIFLYHDDFHRFYYRRILPSKELEKIIDKTAIFFSVTSQYFNYQLFEKFENKSYWVPWSVPATIVENTRFHDWQSRINNVIISGFESRIYPLRKKIYKYAKRTDGLIKPIKHPTYHSNNISVFGDDYYELLRKFKGAISTTAKSPINFTVMKYFEIPACGCVPFFEDNPELRYLGFIDGMNCIIINHKDFLKKINILKSPMAVEIAQNAHNLIRNHHTLDKRIKFMVSKIDEYFRLNDR